MWQQFKRKHIKRPLRKLARKLFGHISALTINKHRPVIITIIGNGPTSIVREAVYAVVKESQPVRRNIEIPEAEFSIPLTVLGYKSYPQNYRTWIWCLLKAYLQLLTVRPFRHTLVLELNPVQQSVLDYWLSILKPTILLQIGHTSFEIKPSEFQFFKNYKISSDTPEAYFHIAQEVGEFLQIAELDIELGLATIKLPEARLRLLPGKNNSLVIDATHYYFPIKLASVLESLDIDGKNLIAFSPYELDQQALSKAGWLVNPENYKNKKGDLVLLRGRRSDLINKFGFLVDTLVKKK